MLSVSVTGAPVFLLFSLPFSDSFAVLSLRVVVVIRADIRPRSSAVPHLPDLPFRIVSSFSPRVYRAFAFVDSFTLTNILFTFSLLRRFPHSFRLERISTCLKLDTGSFVYEASDRILNIIVESLLLFARLLNSRDNYIQFQFGP